jgi:putative transposase
MARQSRVFVPGCSYHVIQRGNNRINIFGGPRDYAFFLQVLTDACARTALAVNGYVLMTTHVHLVVTPPGPDAIAKTMQLAEQRYVRRFNDHYGRTGGLFEGRYRSFAIDREDYWLKCMRYVELNPTRAGLTTRPADYRWSSYRAHAFGAPDPVLSRHALYDALGATENERREAWRAACAVPLRQDELDDVRECAQKGRRVSQVAIAIESRFQSRLRP